MKKRILSAFLAVLMILGSVGTFVIGTSAADEFKIAVEAGEIQADGTVHVNVMMYNNPGLSSIDKFEIAFDNSVLKLVSYDMDDSDAIETCMKKGITSDIEATNVYDDLDAVYIFYAQAGLDKSNGKLIGLTFQTLPGLESTEITINYEDDSLWGQDYEWVDGQKVPLDYVYYSPVVTGATIALPEITGVTLEGATYTYDGQPKSLAVKGADSTMTVSYDVENVVDAKTYNVTATVQKPGYCTLTLKADLVINPREVTLSGVKATDKVYDGNTTVVINDDDLEINGLLSGDDLDVDAPAEGTIASANVGNNLAVTYGDLTVTGEDASNYKVVKPNLTVNVTPLVVTVTPDDGQVKTVNTEDPVLTYTYDKKDELSNLGVTLTGALGRETGSEAGKYAINLGNLKASDDNVQVVLSDTVVYFEIITKPQQEFTYEVPSGSFTYGDGNDTFDLDVNKVVGSDNAVIYSSSNEDVVTVSEDGIVTVVGAGTAIVTISVAEDDTYGPYNKTVEFVIDPKLITITPQAGQSFVYGSNIVVVWDISDDSVASNGGKLALESTNVGTQKVVIGTLAPLSSNYSFILVNETVEITPATATVTGIELWPAENGEIPEIKDLNPVVSSGVISGDTVTVITGENVEVKTDDGENYYVSGLTSGNDNYVLDTTVVPTFVAKEELPAEIATEVGTPDLGQAANGAVINGSVISLPYGYTAVLTGSSDTAIVDPETGVVTAPAADTDVTLTYTIYDPDGSATTETFTATVKVVKKSSNAYLQMLLLYYHKKLQSAKATVETVKASVATGSEVAAGTKVALSTATAGATIYYTTDGSVPTVLSNVYTGPIAVNSDMTISAIAAKSGMKTSASVSYSYTVADTSIALKADADSIKYMEGRGDKFEADADATRYEVIAALANVFDIKTTNAPKALTDVADEYKELVDRFTAAGIIDGFSDNTFRGDESITREQIAKIICVMMNLDETKSTDAGFNDVEGWSVGYVNACANAGYVQGKGNDRFAPKENITRGQLATLINNITGAKAGTSCSYSDVAEDAWYFGAVAAAAK
ncbi:MAG: S-layer homology domain-containing protein [Clostridia bacterium]|nr:S-layer homology domain-containing protein [Clostridia bacterium]